jgi:ribonuclease III
MKDLENLLAHLGLSPGETSLVRQALTHSSCSACQRGRPILHNERLEYLGDAVLELVVSDYLYHKYPHLPEGKLTRLRAHLVRESTLVGIAETLGLKEYMALGKGTEAIPSIMADAVEALVGAVFLTRGYGGAKEAVTRWFQPVLADLEQGHLVPDYKTFMQEYAQDRHVGTPEYRIVSEYGPDHDKTFTAEFLLGGEVWAAGTGKSKKEAEQVAAQGAYERLMKK